MADLDQLRISWAALASAPGSTGGHVSTLALDQLVEDMPILVGADIDGDRHLLVPTSGGPVAEDSSSAAVQIRELELGSPSPIRYTDVVCRARRLADVFEDLILAILREIAIGRTTPSNACGEILTQWRSLLRPPVVEPLNVNQMAGLAAELRLAIDILDRDPYRRLEVWRGPGQVRHDFRRAGDAIEVKATLSQDDPSAEIHGLEQLAPPEDGSLHLVWFRLERVPEGKVTVAALVEELRQLLGGGSPPLYERLAEAGWRPESAAERVGFEFRERLVHRVDGNFPRLVPSMLPGGHAPSGVSNIRYEVAIDPTRAVDDAGVEAMLTRIATAEF
jgi:hypothetical protein